MFRIVICDEKKESSDFLTGCVNRIIKGLSVNKETELFRAKPEILIDYKIRDEYTYLFFLDVIYSNTTGIDIARKIREQRKRAFIVFVTAHVELLYMLVNQNIMPSGFISKPADENDIRKAVLSVLDYYNTDRRSNLKSITISTGSAVYKISYDEIIYIEALNKKINIYTDKQRISCYNSLSALSNELGESFLRCHNSYIINKQKVKSVHLPEQYIEMENGSRISISRTYKTEVKKLLQ